MGPLATANQQIRDAEQRAIEMRVARLSAPHRTTDRLLDQLEELNLDGVQTVPPRYGPILEGLREQLTGHRGLSPRVIDRLRPGIKTADLIEAIFAVQEIIAPPTMSIDDFPFDDAAEI